MYSTKKPKNRKPKNTPHSITSRWFFPTKKGDKNMVLPKTEDNIYYQARIKAAESDPRLSSREGASEVCNISRDRLVQIEQGTTTAHPDEITRMALAYKAQELLNHYCTTDCPLGIKTIPKFNIQKSADRAILKLDAEYTRLRRLEKDFEDLKSHWARDEEDDSKELDENYLPLLREIAESGIGFYVRTQELMHFVKRSTV